MIPQIIVTVWLTLTWVFFVRKLGVLDAVDTAGSILVATGHTVIIVAALYYGNFWAV